MRVCVNERLSGSEKQPRPSCIGNAFSRLVAAGPAYYTACTLGTGAGTLQHGRTASRCNPDALLIAHVTSPCGPVACLRLRVWTTLALMLHVQAHIHTTSYYYLHGQILACTHTLHAAGRGRRGRPSRPSRPSPLRSWPSHILKPVTRHATPPAGKVLARFAPAPRRCPGGARP